MRSRNAPFAETIPKKAYANMAPAPTILVLFGGARDLAWRKLVPSLFDLHQEDSPRPALSSHAAGTWCPKAADALLARAGRAWRPIA